MTKANGFSAPAHSPRLLAGQPRECSPSQECSNHSLIGHWPIPAACLTMWLTRCTTLEKRHPCCRFYNWDDTLEATWPLRPWPYRMVATWTLDLCSSRTRPAQCPVSGAQCPVSSVWLKLACHRLGWDALVPSQSPAGSSAERESQQM